MAINSFDIPCDKTNPKSLSSANSSNLSSCRLVKINFATEGSICSAASKRDRKKNADTKSPYLNGDNVHLLSQVTEKTFVHKKGTTEFVSSFPLAVNIYKANSDEFKSLKKANRKAKKSVLTLPNDQAPMPKTCTVSDMNDSEYFNQDEHSNKFKKRNLVSRNRKSRPKGRDYEFYDRDARYCSQMNINLDCSSTDMIQEKRIGKSNYNVGSNQEVVDKPNPHDVWAVLRNINRFQFRPSPPMSEDSFITPKKKKGTKRRTNRKDMRVVETCRTEEFAYISSFEVDSRSPHSFSKSSSFDRITVIDKQDEFSKICKELEKSMLKTKNFVSGTNNKPQNRNQNNKSVNNRQVSKNNKSITQKANNPKMLALEYNSKKQCNNNCGDTKQNKVRGNKDFAALGSTKTEDYPTLNETNGIQLTNEMNMKEEALEQEFIYSGNSGSSKAAASNEIISKRVSGKTNLASDDFHNPFNGITKVILSKGPAIPHPKVPEPSKRKRQVLNLPPSHPVISKPTINTVIPKLTQTDIKRRLAKLKFPIVVLGKDQLSSNYEVPNIEPTQFNGLNEQVWPFMVRWQNENSTKLENTPKTKIDSSQKKKCSPEILEFNKIQKINRGFISTKQLNIDKKATNDAKNKNTSKVEQKRITPPAELHQQTQPIKPKPIRQFKEKMLKLLYKNSSVQNFAGENSKPGGFSDVKSKHASKITRNKVDASTDMRIRTIPKDGPRNLMTTPGKAVKQAPTTKQPWAKARWASDFIDNVIRKIKNGVYYTHESKLPNQKHSLECKEVEIQTVTTHTETNPIMQSISKITIKKKKEPLSIPGFDDNMLPPLEIKTMNKNEISVKHCVTNIVFHFDVSVPNEPVINLKRSSSFIPLDVSESQTKIFKCKTSIMNAMLPAELCSILPKMMWNIIESGKTLALPPVPVDKSASHLSTISEIRCESPEPFKLPFFPHLRLTLELRQLINGLYSSKKVTKRKHTKIEARYDRLLTEKLLPRLSRSYLFDCMVDPNSPLKPSFPKQTNLAPVKDLICKNQFIKCMALQTYPARNCTLVPAFKPVDLTSFLRRMSSYVTTNMFPCSRVFNNFFDRNITISLITTNSQGLKDTLSINISKFMMDTKDVSKDFGSTFETTNQKDLPAIQCIALKAASEKTAFRQNHALVSNKPKRKGFIKLYRKCKSTSNISDEKGDRTSTSLSKITNLDEFFQALGTAKMFSRVFDNLYGHKILSSIKEMKSWITDINPTQALLVLLLMNKKDTPNLVRFRPVLLQGIAVNRITRANELDMEIEVIEREHLNRLSQYDGKTYLPESAENQDNLLEELCWIAKTTASDYQRTFDESSEKLLKSLLEKRKKLNPSYLRVMARYVGLGLLKSPIKH